MLLTSVDGYCSVVLFEPGELGEAYTSCSIQTEIPVTIKPPSPKKNCPVELQPSSRPSHETNEGIDSALAPLIKKSEPINKPTPNILIPRRKTNVPSNQTMTPTIEKAAPLTVNIPPQTTNSSIKSQPAPAQTDIPPQTTTISVKSTPEKKPPVEEKSPIVEPPDPSIVIETHKASPIPASAPSINPIPRRTQSSPAIPIVRATKSNGGKQTLLSFAPIPKDKLKVRLAPSIPPIKRIPNVDQPTPPSLLSSEPDNRDPCRKPDQPPKTSEVISLIGN